MNDKNKRIDKIEYFLKIATVVAERSTCLRHNIGTILVKDRHIIATGYNGAPSNMKDCLTLGCLRNNIKSGERTEICRAVHSEENALIQCAIHNVSPVEAIVYSTHTPCRRCAKMLCNAKISAFISYGEYNDNNFIDLFQEAGISFKKEEQPSLNIKILK